MNLELFAGYYSANLISYFVIVGLVLANQNGKRTGDVVIEQFWK